MIRIKLKQLIDEKAFNERTRITLNDVAAATGISRPTLTRIANVPGYNTNTDTVNALCKYFACPVQELLQFLPDD